MWLMDERVDSREFVCPREPKPSKAMPIKSLPPPSPIRLALVGTCRSALGLSGRNLICFATKSAPSVRRSTSPSASGPFSQCLRTPGWGGGGKGGVMSDTQTESDSNHAPFPQGEKRHR